MNVLHLALANIRKSKSAAISLFIFILVAALLLNVGLTVISQIHAFFDDKVAQLKDPHVSIVMDKSNYDSTYEDYFTDYPGVTEVEAEEIVSMEMAKFNYGNSDLSSSVIILNADTDRKIGPLTFVEKINTPSAQDIFVPYSFKTNGGNKLNDEITITFQDNDYTYRIAGFFETTMMGTNNMGVMKFMLPQTPYERLTKELNELTDGVILSAVMEDVTQSAKLERDFIQTYQQATEGVANAYIRGLNVELVKAVNTLTINIIATILVAFAAIIVLVSLIVIGFRVSNSIEDGMTNIGVFKAIGYTSRQIISSYILQFIIIAFCASIVGIALSYVFMPFFGNLISTLSGLIWQQNFDFFINIICIFLIMFCVTVVTLLSSGRVKGILPVAALRGGVLTHSFKKNYFPLETSRGGLHFLLGSKSLVINAKQNIMILLIIIALTFASVFSVVLYYNIASDKTAFINLSGTEPANVYISVQQDSDIGLLKENIEKMDHVSKVRVIDLIETTIEGQSVYTNVTDDYSLLESNTVYEGRQPNHENEISISWVVSNQTGKEIGDMVEVEYGNESKSYLVTGLSQSFGNEGTVASVTFEGIQQLKPDYEGFTLYVYLDGISNKEFISNIQSEYGEHIFGTIDIDENIESQTGMFTTAVLTVMIIVLIITVLVVVMILYLVIKTMIIKRRKEFGVMKAIGYSTIQLMNQISISFLPVIISGTVIGGVLGYFFTNPMLSVLLSSAGVKSLDFTISLPIILLPCVGILVLAYLVSMLVSRRIKKISAYSLITE
ncbi:ABC transporter permease [Sutcliffiella rhizosphaerae]|uniref:ABC3 transporter permease C-terminal domain-containing protein n=1 Tax=Sutcliffiella rhizosphaerae TaxID=2880967 RepID=A0ABN8AHJ0_9BACI|nr:ABC transporter permease [Sutcliffiella rhizosphaerae]CAG9622300.1 hypothetical protein BACCIP111883_03091 [Sutcliffiella rhizosphaerae]